MILGHSKLPHIIELPVRLFAQGFHLQPWAYVPRAQLPGWLALSICCALAERGAISSSSEREGKS